MRLPRSSAAVVTQKLGTGCDITSFLSKGSDTADCEKSSTPRGGTLSGKLWALARNLPSEKILEITRWAANPTITSYRRIKKLLDSIPGATRLLRREVPLFPYDTDELVRLFKKTAKRGQKWSTDQIKTVRRILRFLSGDGEIFRVNGYAGTGKTTVLVRFIMFLIDNNLVDRIALVAPTHGALDILKAPFANHTDDRMRKIVRFSSMHKLLGFEATFNDDGQRTFVQSRPPKLDMFNLIIVDESSMVDADMSEKLINCKVKTIVSGDPDQLPPVNEPHSKLCIDPRIKLESTLRQTVRNRNDDVVRLFMALRKWIERDIEPKWRSLKSPNIHFYGSRRFPSKLHTRWMQSYLTDTTGSAMILSWTRRARDSYNDYVRRQLFPNKEKLQRFEPGERLLMNDFYKIPETDDGGGIALHTNSQLRVITAEVTTITNPDFASTYPTRPLFSLAPRVERDYQSALANVRRIISPRYKVWRLQVQRIGVGSSTASEVFTVQVLHEDAVQQHAAEMKLASGYIMNLRNTLSRWHPTAMKVLMKQVVKPMFKEFNRVMVDAFCECNYGYARTVHSSQGQSMGSIWVDMNDILLNPNIIEARKCLYTSMTRASGMVHILL
jgi:hypothetical protein